MQRRRAKEPGWVAATSPFVVLNTTAEGDRNISFSCFVPTNEGSKYGNAVFKVDVVLIPEFPRKSPSMSFYPPIKHSNVEETRGAICWDATGPGWVPSQVLHHVIEFDLPFLLDNPNHDDPHNPSLARLAAENPDAYWQHCRVASPAVRRCEDRKDLLKPLTEEEIAAVMKDTRYTIVEPVELPGSHQRKRQRRSGNAEQG